MLVAVEDDQVEIIDLFDEELAGREGDQRQLVDRRAVLLFRRTQDGEMHEVDRGVRFQEVAPGALAGMRFARDEQDAQVLADALDQMDGAVVDVGDFAGRRGDGKFEHIVAAAWNAEGKRGLCTGHGGDNP